jgi:hypothetical protein
VTSKRDPKSTSTPGEKKLPKPTLVGFVTVESTDEELEEMAAALRGTSQTKKTSEGRRD